MGQVDRNLPEFEFSIPVVIVGAGACGMSAAIAARQGGADVLVLERDAMPLGTTSMSSGLIPAANTKAQQRAGITSDTAELFASDLAKKVGEEADKDRLAYVCEQSTVTVDWLIEDLKLPLTLFGAGSALPGHSRPRLHGTANRTGEELLACLVSKAEELGVDIMPDAKVTTLYADTDNRVCGVAIERPDGSSELIGCDTLILASCGYAANREIVEQCIPEIGNAVLHTHPGAQGDALNWGRQLGAKTGDLSAYQGHASLAAGQGLLVSYISIGEGGFQVNRNGERFSNEALGYSEQAVHVAAQPDGFAWHIFDNRISEIMQEIVEYRDVMGAGALRTADTVEALAELISVPAQKLAAEMEAIDKAAEAGEADRFGRTFNSAQKLQAPFVAVKVNGALFHTQGGLEVDHNAQVIAEDGGTLPNLFAGGGAARGVSGSGASGYVAGNGLMTATTYGRLAGTAAATLASQSVEAAG